MRYLNFTKMSAAGNDFILVDNRRLALRGAARLARCLTDRRHSIGADGLILLEKSKRADLRMRIFNPDGSEAEMCGNGIRCLAKFAFDGKFCGPKASIETLAGVLDAAVRGDVVKIRMGNPGNLRLHLGLSIKGKNEIVHFIDTGVPHAVKWAQGSLEKTDVEGLGRLIRRHPRFAPRGANADFIAIRKGGCLAIRTYERGVEGETAACGTGAAAGALVAAVLKNLRSPVTVLTRGGENLKVYFSKTGGHFRDVFLEGPVRICFEGRVNL